MTHTEKIHVIFGILAAITGALALWSVYRPASRLRLVWPIIAFLIGLFLFIPVEAQTRTYQEVGWWDAFLSVVPQHPARWASDWFHFLPQRHVVQHKVGSLLMMSIGVIEFRRAQGRLSGKTWGLALPVVLLGIAIAFGIHGGTAAHLSHRTEQVHHHLLGVAFAVAAIALALVRTGRVSGRPWDGFWAALILAVGIDIAIFYRLTPAERGPEAHHHESAGPGMR
jgi:uncharacterized membrane protein